MFLKKWFSIQCYRPKKIALILILLGITTLQAQQINPISLQEAIKIAKENNKNILKSRIEVDISKENIKETKELRLPEIDFNGGYSRVTNLTEFKGGFLKDKDVTHTIPEMYNIGTAIKVPLYAGNKINNAIAIANQESKIAQVKSEKAENDIQLEVIATYLGIQKMMELQKIIDENIKEEQSRLKEVQSLKNHGTITKNEVLRAELQLSDRELNALTNSKNIKIALHELKTILQLPEEQEIAIDTTASFNEDVKMDNYNFYLNNTLQNEEMRIANQEIEIKKTELKLAKGNYYPTINFFGDYNLKYPNYMFFPPNPYLYSLGQVGIEATFSLSGLYKNKTKVHIANSRIELQKTQSEIVKNKVQDELFRNHTQYEEITEKIKVVDKALKLATENYRIVKLKYLNQLVLITEMVDADNALLQAKYNKIATRIDAEMKHYELLHTAGLLK
ncbi:MULTISPECIES: TolC family protein [unclassified Flavobacterium]|uniref:TolC family protein n=1 Tax=unclassified Flavobacterium TaxID=196869 RepID=UPI00057F4979|nr:MULTISPECIES: TolC family protein [unclassified Flavobacterium]KIA93260.1 transporter [Flavobacterium sp. KMS]OUL61454.1 transporter [Flavobacterium sp. AJR]